MGESTEKADRQGHILGYLLTENFQNKGQQDADKKTSTEQKSHTGPVVPNTYTLGNVQMDD